MKNLKNSVLPILLLISLNVFSQVEYNIDKVVEIVGVDTLELPSVSKTVTINATFSDNLDTRQFVYSNGDSSDVFKVIAMKFYDVSDLNALTVCQNNKGEIIETEHDFKKGTIKYDANGDGVYEKVAYISRN